jgi:phosphoglycolate phosphatase-like HAD superfamily hydrolase
MMFRNIIWDVDGTLFDTYPSIAKAFKATLNELGKDTPLDWIQELARESLGHCASVLAEKYHLDVGDLERAFDGKYALMSAEEDPPFPGVLEVCQHICAIGGKNIIVTHRGLKGTLELLTAHNMTGYFAGCLTRDDGYPRKPDPAIFEAAIMKYQLKREETLTVGDRDIDIVAGQAAGILSCLFGTQSKGAKADLVINSFHDLYPALKMNNERR